MYRKISEKITSYLRNNRISVSGEINILAADSKRAIMTDEDLYGKCRAAVDESSQFLHPIKISISRDLHELTIKFFSSSALIDGDFLEKINSSVIEIIKKTTDDESLKFRVNFFGQTKNWYFLKKFMMVNNGHDIYSKITEETKSSPLNGLIGKIVDDVLLRKIF